MNDFRLQCDFVIPYISIIDQTTIGTNQDSDSWLIFIIDDLFIKLFHFTPKALHAHALPAAGIQPINSDRRWFSDRLQFTFITG